MVTVHFIVLSAESSPLFQPSCALSQRSDTSAALSSKILVLMCVSKEAQIAGEPFTNKAWLAVVFYFSGTGAACHC